MDLITVRELYRNRVDYLDKELSIGGWVRSVRGSKAFGFIVVSDGSYFDSYRRHIRPCLCGAGAYAQYGRLERQPVCGGTPQHSGY